MSTFPGAKNAQERGYLVGMWGREKNTRNAYKYGLWFFSAMTTIFAPYFANRRRSVRAFATRVSLTGWMRGHRHPSGGALRCVCGGLRLEFKGVVFYRRWAKGHHVVSTGVLCVLYSLHRSFYFWSSCGGRFDFFLGIQALGPIFHFQPYSWSISNHISLHQFTKPNITTWEKVEISKQFIPPQKQEWGGSRSQGANIVNRRICRQWVFGFYSNLSSYQNTIVH